MLDIAGMKGVDCLPDSYAVTPKDLQAAAKRQKVELRKKDVVLVRTGRMSVWPDFHGYLDKTPGISLASAKWLCEEVGAMCIGGRHDRARGAALRGAERLPARPRLHVLDRRRADHRGREHGGDRGREAVRVRVPRLPAQAAGRDRRADARRTRCRSRAREGLRRRRAGAAPTRPGTARRRPPRGAGRRRRCRARRPRGPARP